MLTRAFLVFSSLSLGVTGLVGSASAESAPTAPGKADASSQAATTSSGAAASSQPNVGSSSKGASKDRRDDAGITGISPFWEAIVRGDAALLALDLDRAEKEYQAAVAHAPRDPVGHLRLAQLCLKQNELEDAREFASSAVRFSDTNPNERTRALSFLASVLELAQKYDQALVEWKKVPSLDPASSEDTAASQPGTTSGAPATPTTEAPATSPTKPGTLPLQSPTAPVRVQVIEKRKQLLAEYASVKERIAKNVEAADEATGAAAQQK